MKKFKVFIILVVFVFLTFPLHGSKWEAQAQSPRFRKFNVLNYTLSNISLSPAMAEGGAPSFASRTVTNTVPMPSVAEDNSLSNNLVTDNKIITVSSPHFSLDLPSGYKVGINNGWPIFQWKQVWINSRNAAPIPANAIYVTQNPLSNNYGGVGFSMLNSLKIVFAFLGISVRYVRPD